MVLMPLTPEPLLTPFPDPPVSGLVYYYFFESADLSCRRQLRRPAATGYATGARDMAATVSGSRIAGLRVCGATHESRYAPSAQDRCQTDDPRPVPVGRARGNGRG